MQINYARKFLGRPVTIVRLEEGTLQSVTPSVLDLNVLAPEFYALEEEIRGTQLPDFIVVTRGTNYCFPKLAVTTRYREFHLIYSNSNLKLYIGKFI